MTINRRASYADVAGAPRYPIFVESRDPRATSQDIIGTLKQKVDVVSLEVEVSGVHPLKKQRVAVTCDTENSQRRLREAIKEVASDLTTTSKLPRNPLVRLIGVANDLDDAKLVDAVKRQNAAHLKHIQEVSIRELMSS